MIPLVQEEVVNKYKWVDNEQFADLLAITNSLPAPIGTKLAGMIGYRVRGWLGATVAITGVFLPTTLVVVFLGSLIMNYAESPALQSMLKGVRPVVAVLLAQTAIQMGQKAFTNNITWIFGAVAMAALLLLPGIHPAFLVVASMLLGYLIFKKR